MTANSAWPNIKNELLLSQTAAEHSDLTICVFQAQLYFLIHDITVFWIWLYSYLIFITYIVKCK